MAKVFEVHDRNCFEVYGYSIGPAKEGRMRQRLIKSFDTFDDVQDMTDKDIALLARQDKIDIAIDLTGYTTRCRPGIFAYRAAPIQINYLGYPGTMGADFIDYIIADQIMIPQDSRKFYSEKPIYLPHSFSSDNTMPIAEQTPTRSDLGLPEKAFVFCALHNSYKISPSEFNIWMRLLKHVDGSVLWLLESNRWMKSNLIKEAKIRGVDPDRLVFAKHTSHEEYLAQFRQADLQLDTFNITGGSTSNNALWAGLPVLTKLGKSYGPRITGSLLTAIGFPELMTTTEAEYEALALKLATNPKLLSKIRQRLDANRLSAPLFDTESFTKHLEEGYQKAYQRYFDGKEPGVIFVTEQSETMPL
jgi:predicted O-linked N-acetylglucosamine transferase (SPINDLY family)